MTMAGKDNSSREVRILLVGDPGVGKTSLIFSLVSEEFSEEVPARAEEITIPPEVTPDKVTTQIVDYSSSEQSVEQLQLELEKASVICIVYSVEDDDTIDRIQNYWLPAIRDTLGEEHKTPVVLVGNKSDLVEYSSLDVILPIMSQYSEVETCVECSAKTLKNIAELFFYSQKAVLHPTGPLYSADDRDLTSNCKRALARIFRLCDDNNDGILSDDELNAFQVRCFGSPLQAVALDDVKSIVKRTVRDGLADEGLTLSGFLFLHTLFIQRGRHETTWTVLRRFGYNDNVEMDDNYLRPAFEVPSGASVELTLSGYRFLNKLFAKYDIDGDGALCASELDSLFSLCPSRPPGFNSSEIPKRAETNENGDVTLSGFLGLWTLLVHVEPKTALEQLAYLGFTNSDDEVQSSSTLSAIKITRDKRIDLQKRQTIRNVFSCHVIGPQGAGKSAFLKSFVGHSLKDDADHDGHRNSSSNQRGLSPGALIGNGAQRAMTNYSVNCVQIYGQEKYLVLREVDIFSLSDRLSEPELLCDVVCLVYDLSNPRSFEYVARIYLKHFSDCKLPVLVMGAKSDLDTGLRQEYLIQPEEFCAKYKLPKPHVFSAKTSSSGSGGQIVNQASSEVYVKLATMAAYPNLRRLVHALLLQPSGGWRGVSSNLLQRVFPPNGSSLVRTGIGLATIALVGLIAMRWLRNAR